MSRAKQLGDKGEKLARDFLSKKGYQIQHTNYHGTYGEIDIICKHKDTLVFIEVKAATSRKFGDPLEWVDQRKQQRIGLTAEEYMNRYIIQDVDCRFDVVTIDLNTSTITHYENAFWLT